MSEKSREQEILEAAKEHFRKVHPALCANNYYLDDPSKSDTMTAFIAGAEWADYNPQPAGRIILELIHQRSIAFDEAREYRLKAERYEAVLKEAKLWIDIAAPKMLDSDNHPANLIQMKISKALNDETQAEDVK